MSCPKTIKTSQFSVPSKTVTRLLVGRLAARKWFVIAMPFVLLATAGLCFDNAFYFVALMYLFLIVPTLVMIAYFNEILRVSAIKSTYAQSVIINLDCDCVTVSYAPITDTDSPVNIDLSDQEYKVDIIRNTFFTARHILIRTAPHDYIIIPMNALESADLLELGYFCNGANSPTTPAPR